MQKLFVNFPFLDIIYHRRFSRLINRAAREIRYRWFYPRIAWKLFAISTGPKDYTPAMPIQGFFQETSIINSFSTQKNLHAAQELIHHQFTLLNLPSMALGQPVDWLFAPDSDRLWQYNLHYGEWALTLSHAFLVTRESLYRDVLIRLMTDWINNNPVGSVPGWEPYPISRRLVAWTRIGLAMWEDHTWRSFWQQLLSPSIRQQAQVLAANQEYDLANNHLIANYRALSWIGLLFPHWPEADGWRTDGLNGLWAEMRRQVLSSGVHDERSISYHTIVIQDLLETWQLCRGIGQTVPADVEPTLYRMFQFLTDMQTPDGKYPMLNDTVPDYPMDPRNVLLAGGVLFNRSEWALSGKEGDFSYKNWLTGKSSKIIESGKGEYLKQSVSAYPDAGYVVLRNESGSYLCFDAGPMGPNHLPGHGHADALSFVLYEGGRPLIIDPGVFSYHNKYWRDYFRSTLAHNTVAIDGQDQCVFCGAFRVAYPPKVRLLEWSERKVVGEHEGYCRLWNPVLHRRHIEKKGLGEWELFDCFEGRGEHDFTLTLQFALGAEATHIEKSGASVQWADGRSLRIIPLSCPLKSKAAIENGWVSSGWNLKEKAPRYVLRWHASVPTTNRLILKIVD